MTGPDSAGTVPAPPEAWRRHGFEGSPRDLVAEGTLPRAWAARWAAAPTARTLAGASAAILPRFDVDAVLDTAAATATSLLFGVPTMWVRFAASPAWPSWAPSASACRARRRSIRARSRPWPTGSARPSSSATG